MKEEFQLTADEIKALQNILGALSRSITRAINKNELKKETLDEAFEIYQFLADANIKLSNQLNYLEVNY